MTTNSTNVARPAAPGARRVPGTGRGRRLDGGADQLPGARRGVGAAVGRVVVGAHRLGHLVPGRGGPDGVRRGRAVRRGGRARRLRRRDGRAGVRPVGVDVSAPPQQRPGPRGLEQADRDDDDGLEDQRGLRRDADGVDGRGQGLDDQGADHRAGDGEPAARQRACRRSRRRGSRRARSTGRRCSRRRP